MSEPKNIQNKELYNNEEAKKRHTPPIKASDNKPKDGVYRSDSNGVNPR
jgi:hypothetical protein